MHRRPLSREEVREIDRRAIEEYGLPGLVLMENAGRGLADLLDEEGIVGPVVVCCGKGNNGGDGFVLARHLEARGEIVRVVLFADPAEISGDAKTNLRVLERAGTPLRVLGRDFALDDLEAELEGADWLVDALLGTGTQGGIREPYASAVEAINRASNERACILSVDVPSGLDCNSGRPLGPTVRAGTTATFVAPKMGFASDSARPFVGKVCVLEIGVPLQLLDEVFGAVE